MASKYVPKKFAISKEYTRDYRSRCAGRQQCRSCSSPVAIKKDGKPAQMCTEHLRLDKDRQQLNRDINIQLGRVPRVPRVPRRVWK